jgi:hypothetical protein
MKTIYTNSQSSKHPRIQRSLNAGKKVEKLERGVICYAVYNCMTWFESSPVF